MHTICPIDFVQTPFNDRLLCFGSLFMHQCPKHLAILGQWKIGTLSEICFTVQSLAESYETQIEFVSFFDVFVMLLTGHMYAAQGL